MKAQGNTFIVTGGGSGLGLGTVQELLKIGANVVIIDINDRNKSLFDVNNDKVLFVKADITSEENVKEAISLAINKFGETIRGVVNCGGILTVGRIADKNGAAFDLDLFKSVINTNLVGTFNVSRLVASQMIKQNPTEEGERGIIINISSIASIEGQTGQTAYSASKGGVSSMTLPMARDLAKFGIRVVTVAPGFFDTPMAQSTSINQSRARERTAKLLEFPTRFGKAEECAKLVTHLIENIYINAEIIRIDAGVRLSKL